jgi:hypothetical protein
MVIIHFLPPNSLLLRGHVPGRISLVVRAGRTHVSVTGAIKIDSHPDVDVPPAPALEIIPISLARQHIMPVCIISRVNVGPRTIRMVLHRPQSPVQMRNNQPAWNMHIKPFLAGRKAATKNGLSH